MTVTVIAIVVYAKAPRARLLQELYLAQIIRRSLSVLGRESRSRSALDWLNLARRDQFGAFSPPTHAALAKFSRRSARKA